MPDRQDKTFYLRSDVQVEPLFNQWRAWTHLIPPATAAMRLVARHLPLLNSYVADADARCLSPKQGTSHAGDASGDCEGEKDRQMRRLLNSTLTEQARLIELADAIQRLSNLLDTEAQGYPLAPLYEKIPPPLKGYVELLYDSNNNPHIRFIEGLLYRSPYYNTSSQSYALSIVCGDERPSGVSAPRLSSNECLHLEQPFGCRCLDALFAARHQPTSRRELREKLELSDTDDKLFQTFLTEARPSGDARYRGGGVRVRYFGHAAVLVESDDCAILVDPIISYRSPSPVSRYTYEDLPDLIDYVLITHGHQDHLDLESLLQLRHRAGAVVVPRSGNGDLLDPSLKLLLQHIGFRSVIELDEMESIQLQRGHITAIPFLGEHSDLNVRAKTSYAVCLTDKLVLCLADSCNLEPSLYHIVHDLIGDVDILFIGMECEGSPLMTANGPYILRSLDEGINQSRRTLASNYEQGLGVVERFNCKQVYVYAMGLEPWLGHLFGDHNAEAEESRGSFSLRESDRLVVECTRRGIIAERLFGQREIIL